MSTSLESRISSAIKILDLKMSNSEEYLRNNLLNMGIDDSEIGLQVLEAESTTFEDFHKAFGVTSVPIPRQKLAWSILKSSEEKKEVAGSFSTLIQTMKPIGQWSDLDVLEKYGKNCSMEIEEELRKRSKGRNCIIFFEDSTVDTEGSLYMIRKARYQETPSTVILPIILPEDGNIANISDKTMKQVFKVGEFPLDILFECPIHKNVLLIDGYCEECGSTWNTKNTEQLALLRLIREGTSSDPMLYRTMNFDQLSKEFPKIYIKFKELKAEDKLPSLKRRISKVKDGDPFRVSSHRTF